MANCSPSGERRHMAGRVSVVLVEIHCGISVVLVEINCRV